MWWISGRWAADRNSLRLLVRLLYAAMTGRCPLTSNPCTVMDRGSSPPSKFGWVKDCSEINLDWDDLV